jgi:hypothetical protein
MGLNSGSVTEQLCGLGKLSGLFCFFGLVSSFVKYSMFVT